MGRGAVYDGGAEAGNMYAVQGLGIAGAIEVFDRLAPVLHGLADGAHQSGFSHAGAAFQHQQIVKGLRLAEALKQILKSLAAVCAKEEVGCVRHEFSSQLIDFSLYHMRQGLTVTIRRQGAGIEKA